MIVRVPTSTSALSGSNWPPGDAAVVDDFILDSADAGKTVLRLLGSGYPTGHEWDPLYLRMRTGWERAVARLKVLAEQTERASA